MADDKTIEEIDDDAELLAEIGARYEASRDHAIAWRKEARECFAMYAGEQLSQTDKDTLIREGRTPVVFNRSAILIDAVIGYENNNRQETRYIPRTQGDAKVNELLTEAARYFRDQCDAEFEESDAARDMFISGMGWTNDRLSDERNPEYDLVRDRVDPFEMLWDSTCKKPNLADARYVIRKKWMDKKEAKNILPEWDGEYVQAEWLGGDDSEQDEPNVTNPRKSYRQGLDGNTAKRDVPVIEYQYLEYITEHEMTNPKTGEVIKLDDEQWDELDEESKANAENGVVPHKALRRSEWCRVWLIGGEIIKKDKPYPKGCTYHCITGKRDRNTGQWFGVMRSLIDPQKWSNKWLMQIMHLINTMAKTGYDVEKGAIENQADFEANAARPGKINVFTDGALQKLRVQRREMASLPPDLSNLMAYANDSLSDVSGINQELLGMADREQAGVLEYQRKQSAVTLLAPLFDSLRRYRKMAGRCWLYFMQTYLTDGRLVRITNDEGNPEHVPFTAGPPPMGHNGGPPMDGQEQPQQPPMPDPALKQFFDPGVSEYDVIVDQSSSSPNLKEETWMALQPLIQTIGEQFGPDEWELVLDYSPMPESFMEKYREIQQKKAAQPPKPSPEEMKIQADMQMKQQQLQFDQQKAQQDGQIEQQKAQAQMAIKQQDSQASLQIEQVKAAALLELKKTELEFTMQLETMKAEFEMALETKKAENALKVENYKAENQVQLNDKVAGAKAATDKKVAENDISMKKDAEATKSAPLATAITKGLKDNSDALVKGLKEVAAAMSKPRKIERGKDGRATGVA